MAYRFPSMLVHNTSITLYHVFFTAFYVIRLYPLRARPRALYRSVRWALALPSDPLLRSAHLRLSKLRRLS